MGRWPRSGRRGRAERGNRTAVPSALSRGPLPPFGRTPPLREGDEYSAWSALHASTEERREPPMSDAPHRLHPRHHQGRLQELRPCVGALRQAGARGRVAALRLVPLLRRRGGRPGAGARHAGGTRPARPSGWRSCVASRVRRWRATAPARRSSRRSAKSPAPTPSPQPSRWPFWRVSPWTWTPGVTRRWTTP